MRNLGSFVGVFGTIVALSSSARAETPAPAAPDGNASLVPSTSQCLEGHEQSQVARSDGRLLDARQSLLRCSNSACPSLIQSDCARWFDEVGEMVPTVVVTVRRGGSDVMKVEVELDGKVMTQSLTGQEFSVDPGPHEIKIRVEGEKEQSRQVMLARGEKHRLVSFELAVPVSESDGALNTPNAPAPEPEVPTWRPVPKVTYWLAGTAGVLAIGGGVFGVMALSEKSDLAAPRAEGGCKPNCTDEELSTLHRDALFSTGLFIGSAGFAIGALTTYLLRPEVPVAQVGQDTARAAERAVQVMASPHGGFVSYGGTF